MHFSNFVVYLVANILANRACSLRLSNIFIATSIVCVLYCTNFTYKLDAESRELHDLESRGPDVASRA